VITGYLMTAKVSERAEARRFSPWTFWMMRMRRIYPALAVLTIASVIAGWFVTLPAEYTRHLLQALSALTFLSNFAFKSDSGYFAMAAQTKPLLHTWSLSLEWQFYFFMPLIVGLVWRLACAPCQGSMRWSLRCRSSRPCHWRGVCGQASKMRRDRPSSPCRREPGSRWLAD
jgi:peptidoglycan/LPS O-acetylase OafA/YrhL